MLDNLRVSFDSMKKHELRFPRMILTAVTLSLFLFTSAWGGARFCNDLLVAKVEMSDADVDATIPVGTTAYLEHPSLGTRIETQLLGRLLSQDGSDEIFVFLEIGNQTVHYVNAKKTQFFSSQNSRVPAERIKLWVQNEAQEGGTCAAYSLYHCLRQIQFFKNAPKTLKDRFLSESSRIRVLVDSVNKVYLEKGSNLSSAIQKVALNQGLDVYSIPRTTGAAFKKSVFEELRKGWPVLLRFNVAKSMTPQELKFLDHSGDETTSMNQKLWVPFSGYFFQRGPGGHAVVLMSTFEAGGKTYILVSDPNWKFLRIWPSEYLERLESADLWGWTLWFKS